MTSPLDAAGEARAEPSIADLARTAVRLLDDYAAARETALRLASQGVDAREARRELPELPGRISMFLDAIAARVVDSSTVAVWLVRARLARVPVIDADAWALELAALAEAHEGVRRTEVPRG